MIVDRDVMLAKTEMKRRQEWAAEERLARQARRAEQEQDVEQGAEQAGEREPGGFAWLRRLAGAR